MNDTNYNDGDSSSESEQFTNNTANHAERLLRMSGELDAFEHDFGVGVPDRHFDAPSQLLIAASHSWSPASRIALAAAACLVVGVLVWMLSPSRDVAPIETVVAPAPRLAPDTSGATTTDSSISSPTLSPIVHQVVALYRGDSDADGRCPDCWCVAQWSPNWGDGRGTNDLHEDELVQASLHHACVTDPQRVVIVGLTGPVTAMPKSDAEALEMSLCLLKKQSSNFPVSIVDNASAFCLPSEVDYCMTTWDK